MQKLLVVLAVAAAFGVSNSNSARAALIVGSQSFSIEGIVPNGASPAQSLTAIGEFTGFQFVTGSGTTNFSGITSGQNLGNSPFNTSSLAGFTFGNMSFGTFVATAGVEVFSSSNEIRNFIFTGTFTPGNSSGYNPAPGDPYVPSSASLVVALTQAGGAGNLISGTATLNSPSRVDNLVTPEPASLAMFGTMLAPLALGWYRRRSTVAA